LDLLENMLLNFLKTKKQLHMSHLRQFEVKFQVSGGRTIITAVFAENDFKARQLVKMQYPELLSIHYVKPI